MSPFLLALISLRRTLAFATIVAICAGLTAGTLSASSFTITGASTTAQTLGSGAGQTGTVTAGSTLTVSGSTVAVTISGNTATLTNLGTIQQTGTGRVIRDNTGVSGLVVNNGSATNSSALMTAADADVIQMNKTPASVTLNNWGTMRSDNASAGGSQAVDFNAIASGSNVVNNFSTGTLQASEADAVRPGVNGQVNNSGSILATSSTGASSDGVDVQQNTGVIVVNAANWSSLLPLVPGSGTIEGARHGITGGPADAVTPFTTSITNNLGGRIQGDNGSGINIDGFNALQTTTIVNNGTIIGNGHDFTGNLESRDGDGIDVDGLVNVTNTGIIRSINAFSLPSSGLAFSEGMTVGGGTIVNSGTIEGLVAAGNTNAFGRGISLLGNDITNGPLAGTREAIYGNATVTNLAGGLIRGDSDSGIYVDGPASGFTVTVNNNAGATIRGGGATNPAIKTGFDNDTINNAGLIDGSSSSKAINMGGGNNTLNILGGSAVILGSIDGGVGGTNLLKFDLGTGHTFSMAGTISDFSTVEVASGAFALTSASQFTTLSDLRLTGGSFDLNNFSIGSAGVPGLLNFFLSSTSTLDFGNLGGGSNVIDFGGIGGHAFGTTWNIWNYDFGLDHLYFSGTDPTAFGNLFRPSDICFNGFCGYSVISVNSIASGPSYFEVVSSPVPEPATLSLLAVGLGSLSLRRRRRS